MNWLRRLFGFARPPSEVAKPELEDAQRLRTENGRHIRIIEEHVTSRIRADAALADRRVRGR